MKFNKKEFLEFIHKYNEYEHPCNQALIAEEIDLYEGSLEFLFEIIEKYLAKNLTI